MTRISRGVVLLCAMAATAFAGAGHARQSADSDPQLAIILAIEDARAPHPDDLKVLVQAAHGGTLTVQIAAVRALGRLERRDVIIDLLPLLTHRAAPVRAQTANALAQALRGVPLPGDTDNTQVGIVQAALLKAGNTADGTTLVAVCRSLGRLPYTQADQVAVADAFLGGVLDLPVRSKPELAPAVAAAARGLQSLARVSTVAPLSESTVARLAALARRDASTNEDIRRNAAAALASARAYDVETLVAILGDPDSPEVRRIGARALSGAASGFDAGKRHDLIRTALGDNAAMVRLEAVRAWARQEARHHGCGPLIDALSDGSMHVVLAAIDLLGDQCRDDEAVTDRLTAEARTPPPFAWHREAHAFVALAKRSPERAALAMPAFISHPSAHVRRYAARAAALLDDVAALQRLAADDDDNVVEAALPPLRRRLGAESDAAFVAALTRQERIVGRHRYAFPYQVYRTAAIELKGATATPALIDALLRSLQRITSQNHETSRDTRLALIERLHELGSPALVPAFLRLLREDSDRAVAGAIAEAVANWTGTRPEGPAHPARRPQVKPTDWTAVKGGALVLGNGRRVEFSFSDETPLARMRFIELAANGYYNGLTFHRVEPDFIIQGGSPNANEYVGDSRFMRDELGLEMHRRGAVGISTRGRDTGDAQIFINLVDNARLDHEYTVFAHVLATHMELVDAILEGEVITRIELIHPRNR